MFCDTVKVTRTFQQLCHGCTPCLQKLCQRYFLNNSMKHWPILTIVGTEHRDEN